MDKQKLDLGYRETNVQENEKLDKITIDRQMLRKAFQEVMTEELKEKDKQISQKMNHLEQLLQQVISMQEMQKQQVISLQKMQQLEQSKLKSKKKQESILAKLKKIFVTRK